MDKDTFLSYLCYKHLILNFPTNEIINILDSYEEPYEMFYELISSTYEADPDFFILDDSIIDKTQTIINEYRFRDEYRKNNPNYDAMFNDVIVYLNEMKALGNNNKYETLASYVIKEMELRSILVKDLETLMDIISYDFEIYRNVIEDEFNDITKTLLSETTHYFLECCPEIYEDKELYYNTITMLNDINPKTLSNSEDNYRKKVIKRMYNLKY